MSYKIFKRLRQYFSDTTLRKIIIFYNHYFVGLFKRIDKHHIFLSGAGIAFSLILSIIPFLLILFSSLADVIGSESVAYQVNRLIDTAIPYHESAAYIKNFLKSRMTEVVEYRTISGLVGAFALFFTSTWLFSSMRTILNNIFGVTKDKSALIGLLRDFGMVILLVVFIAMATFILPVMNFVFAIADEIEPLARFRISDVQDTVIMLISLIVVFAMFYVFYNLIPYEKLGKRVPAVGAFWATLFWEIARGVFNLYVKKFLSVSEIYGAFILIIVILFWLFYSSLIFIIGAEIAQLYRERRAEYKSTIHRSVIT
ncbi:MAG: YihY/virulence factor BrkB family protein [Melioribacteraceae bacterium]|nr:YihY/virulence factor BrkB family protein [Melioribacteraceae bacterium]MCO6474144.1 YihY/virulence factor BrkB family protein [Melioribacteraceae bacterium]MDD3558460.1 YihY/virulence factor BrkB family protein [Melioribacteraceae bacterium]